MDASIKFKTVDEYFTTVADSTKAKLQQLRDAIKKAAPNAEEVISYNMPAYKQHGVLVYFAAYKSHIGFYPTPAPLEVFKDELAAFKSSKGAVQFPLDKPLPLALVTKIVKFRLKEDKERSARKV